MYNHIKKIKLRLVCEKIQHSDQSRGFWTVTQQSDFSRTCAFSRNLEYHWYFHIEKKGTFEWIRFWSKLSKNLALRD